MVEPLAALEPSPQVRATLDRMGELGRAGRPFVFALDFELQEALLWDEPESYPLCRIGSLSTQPRGRGGEVSSPGPRPRLEGLEPEGEARYRRRFDRVHEGLRRGDSFLCNLTISTPLLGDLSLERIYAHCPAPYKLLLPGRFVCFSPETFVRISPMGRIATYPMKGTIDASLPEAAERLRSDYKEGCEHHTIVDLMRNDLNRIAREVRVERFKYLSEIETDRGRILQMSSEVVGQLPLDWPAHIGSLLLSLLPAGSISGAPKERTCQIIREAEGAPRGFYTGIFGYFDGQELESAVLIRFIEQRDEGNFVFRSGGGITINSQAEEEYRECLTKVYLPR